MRRILGIISLLVLSAAATFAGTQVGNSSTVQTGVRYIAGKDPICKGAWTVQSHLCWGKGLEDVQKSKAELIARLGGETPLDCSEHMRKHRYVQGSIDRVDSSGGVWKLGEQSYVYMDCWPTELKLPRKMYVGTMAQYDLVIGNLVGVVVLARIADDGSEVDVETIPIIGLNHAYLCYNLTNGLVKAKAVYTKAPLVTKVIEKEKRTTDRLEITKTETDVMVVTRTRTAPAPVQPVPQQQTIVLPSLACCVPGLQTQGMSVYQSNLVYLSLCLGMSTSGSSIIAGGGGAIYCNPITGINAGTATFNPIGGGANNPEHGGQFGSGTAGNPIIGTIGNTSGNSSGAGTYNQPDKSKGG